MLTFAIDNPDASNTTIALVSGDRDFAYAVSVLRHRGYGVVVIVPVSSHSSLKAQASRVVEWKDVFAPSTCSSSRKELDASQATREDVALAGENYSGQNGDVNTFNNKTSAAGDGITSIPFSRLTTPKSLKHQRNASNATTVTSSDLQKSYGKSQNTLRGTGTSGSSRGRHRRPRVTDLKWDEDDEVEESAPATIHLMAMGACVNDTFTSEGPLGDPCYPTSEVSQGVTSTNTNDSLKSSSLVTTRAESEGSRRSHGIFAGAVQTREFNDEDEESHLDVDGDGYQEEDNLDSENGTVPNKMNNVWIAEPRATSASTIATVSDYFSPDSDEPLLQDSSSIGGTQCGVTRGSEISTEDDKTRLEPSGTNRQSRTLSLEQRLEELPMPSRVYQGMLHVDAQGSSSEFGIHADESCLDLGGGVADRYERILSQSIAGWDRGEWFSRDFASFSKNGGRVYTYGDGPGGPFVSEDLTTDGSLRRPFEETDEDGTAASDMSAYESSLLSVAVEESHEGYVVTIDFPPSRPNETHKGQVVDQTSPSKSVSFKPPQLDRISQSQSSTSTLKPWANPFAPYISNDRTERTNTTLDTPISSPLTRSPFFVDDLPTDARAYSSNNVSASTAPSAESLRRFSTLISIICTHYATTGCQFMKSSLLGEILIKEDPTAYAREAALDVGSDSPGKSKNSQGLSSPAPIKLKEYIRRAQVAGIVAYDRSDGWSSTGNVGIGLAPGVEERYQEICRKRGEGATEFCVDAGQHIRKDARTGTIDARQVRTIDGSDRDKEDAISHHGSKQGYGRTSTTCGSDLTYLQEKVFDCGSTSGWAQTCTSSGPLAHSHTAEPQSYHASSSYGMDQNETFTHSGPSKTVSPTTGSWTTKTSVNTTAQTTGSSSHIKPPPPPKSTPTFAPLVSVLLQVHKPNHHIQRKPLSNMLLKQFPDIYEQEGVEGDKKFRAYMELAERAGVIRTGGEGKGGWIELEAGWAGSA